MGENFEAWLVLKAFRAVERVLSVEALYRLIVPLVNARMGLKRRPPEPLPACLADASYFPRQQRRNELLNSILGFFPDRLATAKMA